jgi:hypothetical protein
MAPPKLPDGVMETPKAKKARVKQEKAAANAAKKRKKAEKQAAKQHKKELKKQKQECEMGCK